MAKLRVNSLIALTLVALALSACTNQAPYIHNPNEFNRESADFAKEITDRDSVMICYAKSSTTVQDLLAMAQAECGKFGKEARFQKHDFLQCPLTTPARAIFSCSKPK